MNDPKREAAKRLSDEERTKRLQEGGESMRAQLAAEDAQRASRTGQEGAAFSGLTPQEEERRRMMGERMAEGHPGMGESQQAQMAMWGREEERRTMEDRIAREVQTERRPVETGARTPAEQMAEIDRERGYGRGEPMTYSRREGPIEERPTRGEQTSKVAMGVAGVSGGAEAGRRSQGAAERATQGDYGRASGATYYYGGRETQSSGVAAPESSFGRTEHTPSGRQHATQEPTAGERMRGAGEGAAASVSQAGRGAVSKTEEMGGRAWDKTKEYGHQIGEKTRRAAGGGSAEDVASRAGESIGRGIRKVAAVGSGILAGLRRGVEGPREERERTREMRESGREMYTEGAERVREEAWEPTEGRSSGQVRQTEYQEVRRREQH